MSKGSKNSSFIPSPFKCVTEYENEFNRKFNENLAEAVADVVKYSVNIIKQNKHGRN